ncbi:cytochrome P450 [Trametes versicolor FP-101664 SS1]|uniref:cytochrome P450 n=1 Tax=Trametes versicolor (strain FP-101664) TaxID=717944 RepID=UPI0004623031|nr:cytochrome P450 [Trametes versicolor FP-101664 SS1]EIW54929.1 cytochrome P450 [Trametes versicolor FP-101664 SS1]
MTRLLVQAFVLGGVGWLLWKLLRPYVVRSTLDNLPGPSSQSFFYGNLKQIYNKQDWDFHRSLGDLYGPVSKLHGKLGQKILYVFDSVAMHHIAVKEQYIYDEADWFLRMNNYTLGPGLVATTGEQHRRQRKMLNPAFNINHMRDMAPIFYEVAHRLRQALKIQIGERPGEIDLSQWMGRTAIELIGQAGLGHSFDPLVEERSDTLGEALKSFVPSLYAFSDYLQFLSIIDAVVPRLVRNVGAAWLPHKPFQTLRGLVMTMHKEAIAIYNDKKAVLQSGDEAFKSQVAQGKDLMSLMLKANMSANEHDRLSEEELIAQIATFTIAAVDTTSSALSLILHLLSQHPDVQDKVREEIVSASDGKDIGYDDLVSLPYLDAVCRETLRVYPMAPFRFRETREDIVLPLSEPVRGRDGSMISQIPLPKNTTVFVGVISANTNKAIWGPDGHEWKPERWLSRLPETVTESKIPGVYSNLMTFWGGGRACIGFKFSQLEMKVVLATLLSTFKFELSDKPIHWNLAGIIYPTAELGGKTSMPLRVTLLKPESE